MANVNLQKKEVYQFILELIDYLLSLSVNRSQFFIQLSVGWLRAELIMVEAEEGTFSLSAVLKK